MFLNKKVFFLIFRTLYDDIFNLSYEDKIKKLLFFHYMILHSLTLKLPNITKNKDLRKNQITTKLCLLFFNSSLLSVHYNQQ